MRAGLTTIALIPQTLSTEEQEAHTHLISAAPELLEALEAGRTLTIKLLTRVTHGKPTEQDAKDWIEQAEAAIRKAKGE